MNVLRYSIFVVFLSFNFISLLNASIDIGEEISIQYFKQNNFSDYDDAIDDRQFFYSQHVKFYLEGEIKKDVIAHLTLKSIGIWGTENTTNTIKIGNYEYSNYTPWIQNAYIKMNDLFQDRSKIPVSMTVGRQPVKFGDGLIVDDDEQGMNAIRINAVLPYNLNLTILTAKILNIGTYDTIGQKYFNLDGFYIDSKYKTINYSVYYFKETDKTNIYLPNAISKKSFYGLRVFGETEEKLRYKSEIIRQAGKKLNDDGTSGKYDALAFVLSGKADSSPTKMGTPTLKLEYAYGSGDTQASNQIETLGGFSPLCGSKKKEFGDSDYGHIFSELLPGISNRSILSFGVEFNTETGLSFGADYISESRVKPKGKYGEEFDLYFATKYKHSPNIRILYAALNPGLVLKAIGSHVTKTYLELIYKF